MSTERRTRILHVDDDEANRYAVTRTLRRAGFEVVEAVDGAGALREAARQPDLAIVDVRLPDVSGFEVCRRIKADAATANIPVLHLSANFVSGQDKAQGLDGGADAYLVRPVEPVELIATVNALLRTRRTEEALRDRERQLVLQSERLNAALEASNTGTFLYDYRSRSFTEFDANLRRLAGFSSAEPVTLDAALARVHPDDLPTILSVMEGNEQPDGEAEFRAVLPGGGVRWLFGRARVTRDAGGTPRYLIGACTDGTARKQVEQQARRAAEEREQLFERERAARAESERAGRMKDEFLATLSHELRTPLSAILGWSQVLRRNSSNAAALAEGLGTIERNARAQTQIIEDLLDMSRIISGKVSLDPRPTDLSAVVAAAIETVRATASAKEIEIRYTGGMAGEIPIVRGDANRLQQVFWNLLSNAIKFTPGRGAIDVRLGRQGAGWRVEVTDPGEGISEDFLPYVFDRFRQADASTTRRHGGLGLGLAIVKQLVELHGGKISASSRGPGRGSTFTVELPAADAAGADDAPASPAAVASEPPALPQPSVAPAAVGAPESSDGGGGGGAELSGTRVLVVDDDPDSRAIVGRMLVDHGAEVLSASNADDALAIVESARPNLLVSDIAMPGVDGYALIRRIRALGPTRGGDVPAVALTAYARAEDRVRAIRAGFQMHVPKPVEAIELVSMLASLASRR